MQQPHNLFLAYTIALSNSWIETFRDSFLWDNRELLSAQGLTFPKFDSSITGFKWQTGILCINSNFQIFGNIPAIFLLFRSSLI